MADEEIAKTVERRDDDEGVPWDIKRLVLSLGGYEDWKGFITFEVFNDKEFNIFDGDGHGEGKWSYEEIEMDAARRLRDFLNYAVKD